MFEFTILRITNKLIWIYSTTVISIIISLNIYLEHQDTILLDKISNGYPVQSLDSLFEEQASRIEYYKSKEDYTLINGYDNKIPNDSAFEIRFYLKHHQFIQMIDHHILYFRVIISSEKVYYADITAETKKP